MKKQDLIFTYQWTTFSGDEPNVSGYPDGTFFNRNEGFEMLFIIGCLLKSLNLKDNTDGQRMEFMLKKHLPKNILTQRNAKDWIETNWNKSFSCCEIVDSNACYRQLG